MPINNNDGKPVVSIYCLAYNHEKYIRTALDGFVNQKTSFPFEVIVHDDASTDGTAEIIRDYAERYPDIIVPIFQEENKYSQNINIFITYVLPLMKGKYIAVCEGDDYWCDENKLQLQVDWMENHLDYSFIVHNTLIHDFNTGEERLINQNNADCDLTLEEIIERPGNRFHTSSFLYRREFAVMPDGFIIPHVGDYPRSIYLALNGKVRYLHNVMSVYQLNTTGSWSRRINCGEDTNKSWTDLRYRFIDMLKFADEYSHGQYKEYFNKVIRRNEFYILNANNEISIMRKEYHDLYKDLNIVVKTKLAIKHYMPHTVNLLRKLIHR